MINNLQAAMILEARMFTHDLTNSLSRHFYVYALAFRTHENVSR